MRRIIFIISLFFITTSSVAYTLKQTVITALNYHPEIQRQIDNQLAAKMRQHQAFAGWLPELELDVRHGREHTDSRTIEDEDLWRRENGVRLSQRLFNGFATISAVDRTSNEHKAAGDKVAATQETIAQRAVSSYMQVLRTHAIVKFGQENVNAHQETLKKVKALADAGAGLKGDVALVMGRLARAQAALESSKRAYRDSQASYLAIVGQPIGKKSLHWPAVPKQHIPQHLTDAISIAREHNPRLQEVRHLLAADHSAITEARSAFFPKLNVAVSADYDENLSGVSGHHHSRSAMLEFSYNLFNGGADYARVKEQTYIKAARLDQVLDVERDIRERVTLAWQAMQTAKDRLDYLKQHVNSAKKVFEFYQIQFRLGKRELFNVLDQKSELFQAKSAYITGRDDFIRSQYNLIAEMGMLVDVINQS